MPLWGKTDANTAAPKFTTNSVTGQKGTDEYGTKVFGVNKSEAQGAAPGWVRVTKGTGGRAGRINYETLVVTKADLSGSGSTIPTDDIAPVNTVAPAITGTTTVGQTLTVTNGTWTGTATITFARKWLADGVVIAGATATTYLLAAGQLGKVITVEVTATGPGGVAVKLSNATAAVA